MDSKQAIEKLHIIEILASCELEARHTREIVELIERMDEQNQTQAQVLAARDRVIERQAAELKEYHRRDESIIGKICDEVDHVRNADMEVMMLKTSLVQRQAVIERQERMIGLACEWLRKIGCPALADHYCDENCSTEMNGAGCWRRWLEQEAQHD